MNNEPVLWIDPLHDLSVRYAAQCWGKDLPETWGIISRAIKAEDLSNPVPVPEFLLYVSPPPMDARPLWEVPKAEGGAPTGGLSGLWLEVYKDYFTTSETERLKNTSTKREFKFPWAGFLFFLILITVHHNLWKDSRIPEDGAIFPLLISFFFSLILLGILTFITSLIQSIVNRKSKIVNPK